MISYIICAIIAYLIGSISFAVIFTKKIKGFDVREKGSKNAGSTNVLRTAGKGVAVLTLICDIAKGIVAIAIALLIGKIAKLSDDSSALLVEIAGICVVLGHTFPIFFKFKGGKGVATSLGVLLMTNWRIGLICLVFALVVMAISKMVSLGSISAAILYPILCIFINESYLIGGKDAHFSYVVFALILALIVILNHRTNIKRLLRGEENKLSFKETEE